jgi:hypothetical protein
MRDTKSVALTVRRCEDVFECVRSAVGLGMENFGVGLFVIGVEIDVGDKEAAFKENLETIEDLEGEIFSDVAKNADRYPAIRLMTLEDMAQKLLAFDLMAAF